MKISTLIKLLTIPWFVMAVGMIYLVEQERFGTLFQGTMAIATMITSLIMIAFAFAAASESDRRDNEVLRLRKRAKK